MNQGELLRDEGMSRALGSADRKHPDWGDDAYRMLVAFARTRAVGGTFISEEVQAYAYALGLPKPPEPRAWGSIIRRAAIARVIVSNKTYRTGENPTNHHRPQAEWRAA